jgi:hypothetical protein
MRGGGRFGAGEEVEGAFVNRARIQARHGTY